MFRLHNVARAAAVLGIVGLVACKDDSQTVIGPVVSDVNSLFTSYVALGNSITAGYQSGGINDSTQRRSYAVLLSQQMGTGFIYPSLAGRGCVPPVSNFTTQARVGTGSTSSTCDLRNPSFTDILHNVAVPGATVADLTAASGTTASNTLTSLFLGGKTQVQKAIDAKPTFASIWIGNNDVLAAAVSGVLVPMAGVSPGVTAQTAFEASYNAATDALVAANGNLEGALIGVVNVTAAPILFPVAALQTNAAFRTGFDQAAGFRAGGDAVKATALTFDPNCTAGNTTLVSFRIATEIARFRNDTNPTGQPTKAPTARTGHPAHIACGPNTVGYPATVGEVFILTPTEQTTLANAVLAYNAFISAKASTLGWAYMNPNNLLDSLRLAGQFPPVPNLASTTATFGAWVTLDGVHPSTQTHRALTNHLIDAINLKYGPTNSIALTKITVP